MAIGTRWILLPHQAIVMMFRVDLIEALRVQRSVYTAIEAFCPLSLCDLCLDSPFGLASWT